ncbi:DNRLRE domain-containing protein [Lentisphaera marina]|uniref:DNRLRE domain-containing protein n=1 Tax=Lentisphaera marina TaxID=1111041 RepID=UPI00236664D8|nr:DNRLRE domain-containing protein [Lentisphaera marina]MDD7986152.1 DNRLRE domain-containing protein [Lentisphaera marina]
MIKELHDSAFVSQYSANGFSHDFSDIEKKRQGSASSLLARLSYLFLLCMGSTSLHSGEIIDLAHSEILFDFESDISHSWLNQNLKGYSEGKVTIETSDQHLTSGSKSLKLTFPEGHLPSVYTEKIAIADWSQYKTLCADVFLERDSLVVFRALQEKSTRDNGWDGYMGRFERAALMKKGHHTMVALLNHKRDHQFRPKYGAVIRFEIALYDAQQGESIFIDNIRLSKDLPKAKDIPLSQLNEYIPTRGELFELMGMNSKVKDFADLAERVKGKWEKPYERSVEEVEASFIEKYNEIVKEYPKAKLAILRNGQKAFDRADMNKSYEGWDDTYITCHEPESMLMYSGLVNHGKAPMYEMFMRHRSALMRVDLSHLPKESKIHHASLLVCRTSRFEPSRSHLNPNLWVVELCNRPWVEDEANAFQFAKHKYWNNYSGRNWDGENPDSLPIYAAHGPGQGQTNVWDMTEVTRKWLKGDIANHGFWLYGDSKDWLLSAHYSESNELNKRPTLYVIYE